MERLKIKNKKSLNPKINNGSVWCEVIRRLSSMQIKKMFYFPTMGGKSKLNSGFTLVELIVSLGLFIVVITISTGALLSLSDMSRKVQSARIAIDNLDLALESMSKEIRMGRLYFCNPNLSSPPIVLLTGNDCAVNGRNSIAFLSQDKNIVVYRMNGTVIERSIDGGVTFSDITAPEININYLNFYVSGTSSGGDQPRVIITLGGTAGAKVTSEFKIQTTVTQRIPDF